MGSSTNTPIVVAIFAFYTFIFVMMGLIGGSYQTSTSVVSPGTPGLLSFLSDAISFFVGGISFSITNIPVALNVLLFLPLGIGVFYILLSYIRGSS